MLSRILTTLQILFLSINAFPQQEWTKVSQKNGIEVFIRNQKESDFKQVLINSDFPVPPSVMSKIVTDVSLFSKWVFATKSCTLLRQVSKKELYYYSEISVPWPLTNRDFVSHLYISHDTINGIITIDAMNIKDYLPEKKGLIRVNQSVGKWTIQPLPNGHSHVSYTLAFNPAGLIPAWISNLFIEKGPTESFKKLKKLVDSYKLN